MNYEHEYIGTVSGICQIQSPHKGMRISIFLPIHLDRSLFHGGEMELLGQFITVMKRMRNISIGKFGAVHTPDGTEAIVKLTNQSLIQTDG